MGTKPQRSSGLLHPIYQQAQERNACKISVRVTPIFVYAQNVQAWVSIFQMLCERSNIKYRILLRYRNYSNDWAGGVEMSLVLPLQWYLLAHNRYCLKVCILWKLVLLKIFGCPSVMKTVDKLPMLLQNSIGTISIQICERQETHTKRPIPQYFDF